MMAAVAAHSSDIIPNKTECSIENCSPTPPLFFDLVLQLQEEFSDGNSTDNGHHHVCLCSSSFTPRDLCYGGAGAVCEGPPGNENCGNSEAGGTIVIPANTNVVMDCADDCYMACPANIFRVQGNLTLRNFNLGSGNAEETESRIIVESTGSLILWHTDILEANINGKGGGILNQDGSVIVWHSILAYSYAAKEGGAIYTSGIMELHHSMILSSRSGTMGGGLYLTAESTTIINDVRFNFNKAQKGGNNIFPETGALLSGCGELIEDGGESTIMEILDKNGTVISSIGPCETSNSNIASLSTTIDTILFLGFASSIFCSF